jgi:hypothetical protein
MSIVSIVKTKEAELLACSKHEAKMNTFMIGFKSACMSSVIYDLFF